MVRFLMSKVRKGGLLARLHRDEQGAEGLEKLLLIAALVLPLLGILIFFGNNIKEWVATWWDKIVGKSDTMSTDPTITTPS